MISIGVRLPSSSMVIVKYLRNEGKKTLREISAGTGLTSRTVRYAVRRMQERQMVKEVPSLMDMRSHYFVVNEAVVGDMERNKEV